MSRDDEEGGRGEWIGLVGFSQGAKVVASLLLREQVLTMEGKSGQGWRFAVLMAGRGTIGTDDKGREGVGVG